MHESFLVQNVKCDGCAKTIREGLGGLEGVRDVAVTIDEGRVDIEGDGLDRDQVARVLTDLGYPPVAS